MKREPLTLAEEEPEVTTATRAVREQGFQSVQCDIPADLTIAQYRSSRRAVAARRRARRRLIHAFLRR
jgi:hypothetical protein